MEQGDSSIQQAKEALGKGDYLAAYGHFKNAAVAYEQVTGRQGIELAHMAAQGVKLTREKLPLHAKE